MYRSLPVRHTVILYILSKNNGILLIFLNAEKYELINVAIIVSNIIIELKEDHFDFLLKSFNRKLKQFSLIPGPHTFH